MIDWSMYCPPRSIWKPVNNIQLIFSWHLSDHWSKVYFVELSGLPLFLYAMWIVEFFTCFMDHTCFYFDGVVITLILTASAVHGYSNVPCASFWLKSKKKKLIFYVWAPAVLPDFVINSVIDVQNKWFESVC